MATYCFAFKSKVMKILYLYFGLLCLSTSVFSQFNWEHTGGPEGLGTYTTYYNKDFAFLYDDFQLYRNGGGQTWELINSTPSGKIVVTENRLSIYREINLGPDKPIEIQFILSADNGDSWFNASVPNDAYHNNNQVMLCSHGIYFKAGEKLYISQTDGQSWKLISYDGIPLNSLFSADDKIFGRIEDKIFEFNPQLGKWNHTWNAPPSAVIYDVHFDGNNILALGANFLYSSSNQGETWNVHGVAGSLNTDFVRKDNKVYFHSGQWLRYTDNGGQSWESIQLDASYKTFCLAQNQFLLFSDKTACILFDDINNTYLPANEGLKSSRTLHLLAGQYHLWAQLKSNNSLHKLDMRSGVWSSSGLPASDSPSFKFSISKSEKLLYLDSKIGKVLISTNNAISWDTLNIPFNHIAEIDKISWIEDNIYIEGNDRYFISTDFGSTWKPITKPLISPVIFRDQIWTWESPGKIIVSSDYGLSWENADAPFQFFLLHVVGDRIFVSNPNFHSSLYSSADGYNWQFSRDGLPNNFNDGTKYSNKKMWEYNGIYYIQTIYSGLYYSLDNCSSWEHVDLPNLNEALTIVNDTVYIGSESGGGVFKSKMPRFKGHFAKGSIFHDLNGNGIKDSAEANMPDIQIMVSTAEKPQKNYFSLSNQDGQFEIRPTFESDDTIRPNILSEYIESVEPPFFITNDSIEKYDFAVRFHPNITDGKISGKFNIQPRAGRELTANLIYQNLGTIPMSGSVGLRLDPEFAFINSSPPPSELVGADSIVWHFEELPISGKNQILVEGKLSSTMTDGALITMAASIHPSHTDIAMADNHFLIQDSIVSTFIPNQKSVFPAEGMTVEEMLEGKELEYTIRFQNPFDHVVNSVQISDALPTVLDFKSIRIVGSSHEISKWELLPSGILRVFFDNMNLAPNSMEDQRSQGFLSFAIRIRKDNNLDFNFSNNANIIFDKTRTVTTNTVSTKMLEDVISTTEEFIAESHPKLIITPNPASDNCIISTNNTLEGPGTVRIFDLNAQVLYKQKIQDLGYDILLQTDQLSSGFYLITAEGAGGIMHGKLIIQK